MNTSQIWRKFPLFLALMFCVYAVGLIERNLESQRSLKHTEISRVVDLNDQVAATLGDYLAEQSRFVADLAHGADISNYRANKALGMSPRYGLRASLEAVEAALRKVQFERQIGGRKLYARFAFIDDDGRWLIDTTADTESDGRGFTLEPGLTILSDRHQARLVMPLSEDNADSGRLIAWIDLNSLTAFLLPHTLDRLDRTFLLYPNDRPDSVPPDLLREALRAPPGEARQGTDPDSGQKVILTVQAVPSTPLKVATLRDEAALEGGEQGNAFLVIAAVLAILMVVGALGFDVFQGRHARMQIALESSRQRLLAISDNLVEGIVMVDGAGEILFANRAAMRMLGCGEDVTSAKGRNIEDLMRLEGDGALPWRDVLRGGQRKIFDDIRIEGGLGVLDVTLTLSPLMDSEAGQGLVVAFRDIKAMKHAQQQLMQSAQLVSIGQLAAGIAHEINTPAQYVSSNLDFLSDEIGRILQHLQSCRKSGREPVAALAALSDGDFAYMLEDVPMAIQESRDGIAQISRIVRSMKEFSHPGTSHRTAADLNKAIRNTLTVSNNSWKTLAEIDCDLQPDLPLVTCHEAEVNQVFLNLIVNAAQAIELSGKPLPGHIRIGSHADGDQVEIRISDDGCGIPASIMDKIFDPFFTTKQVGKGTGQGLAICRNIVAVKHGGSLTVESVEGEGATFIIRLPVGAETAEDTESAASPEHASEDLAPSA